VHATAHPVSVSLTDQEKIWLAHGQVPLSMDDKWVSYVENDCIHFYRSWTGLEVFQADIEKVRGDQWIINTVQMTNDVKHQVFCETSIFENLIKGQIRRLKKIMDITED